jgi:EAL domain-containing protein (putative c-di-GMP-specific phosphodiesterase class I)
VDVATRLRVKGFRLSIDDFGTGYSSLVQLQRMPFSELKVDRSFVMQMTRSKDCRVIVEIVIDLARKLGLRSVAEGVESQTILDELLKLGCDAAQGYHLSRPVDAGRIAGALCRLALHQFDADPIGRRDIAQQAAADAFLQGHGKLHPLRA